MIDLPRLLMKHRGDILALPYYTGHEDNLYVSLVYKPHSYFKYDIVIGFIHYEEFLHKRWSGHTPEEAYEGAMNDD